MVTRPTIIVQLPTREKVNAFRVGVGGVGGIVTLGLDPKTFTNLAGLDALYLSLTRAERWGAPPLPYYSAAMFRTTAEDQHEGMPPYIVTGMLPREGDPNTAAFAIRQLAYCPVGPEELELIRQAVSVEALSSSAA